MAYAYQTENTQSKLFFAQSEKFGNDIFMQAKFKNGEPCNEWVDITWKEAADETLLMGAGLIEMGIEKGDRIVLK